MSGKCAKLCVAIAPPQSDTYIVHNVHIWSCFAQSCVHARGEISDTLAIPICSKSSPKPQTDPFLSFSCFLPFSFPFLSFSFSILFLFLLSFSFSCPFPFPCLCLRLFLSFSVSFSFPFLFLLLFRSCSCPLFAKPWIVIGPPKSDTIFPGT